MQYVIGRDHVRLTAMLSEPSHDTHGSRSIRGGRLRSNVCSTSLWSMAVAPRESHFVTPQNFSVAVIAKEKLKANLRFYLRICICCMKQIPDVLLFHCQNKAFARLKQ